MPRHARRLIQKKAFISPSQEAILEAIPGWGDDAQHSGMAIDDTPSQPACCPENSSPSSLQRVFDVTGSSLSQASQEAVEWASPEASSPRASDAATKEDSYNEAFESDRSQSPSRTVSWSLEHGCKDPKSPTCEIAPEETEQPPMKLEKTTRVGLLITPISLPAEAAATLNLKVDLELDVTAVAEEVEDMPGKVSEIDKRDGGAQITAAGPRSPRGTLASPRGSFLPLELQVLKPSVVSCEGSDSGLGLGSASAFVSFKGKGQESTPADEYPVAPQNRDGWIDAAIVDAADEAAALDSSHLPQHKLHTTLEDAVKPKDCTETEHRSPSKLVGDDLDNQDKVNDRRVDLDTEHVPMRAELESCSGAAHQVELHVDNLKARDKSRDEAGCSQPLFSPTSLKIPMDAVRKRPAEKPGTAAVVFPENGSQHSPTSPPRLPRPPRAVQEKLDKLRSHSGKRVSGDKAICIRDGDRFHKSRHILPATVMDAIQFRAGARPASGVTTAELLNTALHVGVSLPLPFDRNYFRR